MSPKQIPWLGLIAAILVILPKPTSAGTTYCVWTNGLNNFPYATWENAATSIQTAIDIATNNNDIVLITNGVYTGTGAYVVSITNRPYPLTLQGMGSGLTFVDGQGERMGIFLDSTASNVVVEKLTITRGYRRGTVGFTYGGAGVLMSNGTVRLCTILNNTNLSTGLTNAPGGGVFIANGTLSQCLVVSNSAECPSVSREARGAGVYMVNGTVDRCLIAKNSVIGSGTTGLCNGGGVYASGGTLRNCLVVRNTASPAFAETTQGACAGVYLSGAKVLNCTIAGNSMRAGRGVGLAMTSGSVSNTIVYHNSLTNAPADVFPVDHNVWISGGSFSFSCATPSVAGLNNIETDPCFADMATDNYQLLPGSPCIDAGSNITAAVGSDYDGNARPVDGTGDGILRHDMGAYESDPLNSGAFRCNFFALTNQAFDGLNAVFSARVAGGQTNGLSYWWDFTADGTTDSGGVNQSVVTNPYGYGSASVRLTISNDQNQAASCVRNAYIKVAPAVLYVSTNGTTHSSPYDTPAKAASNVQSALNWALALGTTGSTVLVTNGTYRLAEQIYLSKSVVLRSVAGASDTLLVQTNTKGRVLCLADTAPNAVVDGFTLTGGKELDASMGVNNISSGGGIRMQAGTVRNCVISNNINSIRFSNGGGLYMEGGQVETSMIASNRASAFYNGEALGGGIYMVTGRLERCIIASNANTTTKSGVTYGGLKGAGLYVEKGLIQNLLITANQSYAGDPADATKTQGGGVYLGMGTILNCTIADNSLSPLGQGAGLYMATPSGSATNSVTNSIVYFNSIEGGTPDNVVSNSKCQVSYSCMTPLLSGEGNIGDDPQFANRAQANFRLSSGSPCLDVGTNLAAVANDLENTVRPQLGKTALIHDMGAYEASLSSASLEVVFAGTPLEGVSPCEVVFTATVSGSQTNAVHYWWDFNNDTTNDLDGLGLNVVTQQYQPGYYSVGLRVSNDVGTVTGMIQTAYVHIAPPIIYVATNGTQTLPYDTELKAATNVQVALNEAVASATGTSVVQVAAGTYAVTQQITVSKGVILKSASGPTETVLRKSDSVAASRVLSVLHASAVIDGFTLRDGRSSELGFDGVGLLLMNGTVQNCIIISNKTTARGASGGGVKIQGGVLRNCLVVANEASSDEAHNTDGVGGGIYMTGGLIESCTVVGNKMAALSDANGTGGGIYRTAGGITNCIVYGNIAKTATNDLYATAGVGFTCASDVTHNPLGTGNITNNPIWINPGLGYGLDHSLGDYRLKSGTPCADAGTNRAWMVESKDLAGDARIVKSRVDLGAYEQWLARGTIFIIH